MKKEPEHRIPSAGPSITEAEVKLIAEAARVGWYGRRNEHLDLFKTYYGKLTKRRFVLPTSHATAALHLALIAVGVKKGDEVIIADSSWVAPASAITYLGAKPVFADIDADTWGLSPVSFARRITKRTKAVIVVETFGSMPHLAEILAIAKKHKIAVIEDAAEALGSAYKGKPAGSFGDVSVMSFNATKLATAGQGGVLATNSKKIYNAAAHMTRHGMVPYTPNTTFWSDVIGYNYEWTNMQAAFALAQLRRLPELLRMRKSSYEWYRKGLANIPGITLTPEIHGTKNNRWLTTIVLDKRYRITKEKLLKEFSDRGIDCRPYFYPISSMPPFKKYARNAKKANPVAYDLSSRGISLPSSYALTQADVRRVCNALKEILA